MTEKQTTEKRAKGYTSTGAPISQEYAAGELQKGAPIVERTKIYFPEVPEADKQPAVDLRYRYYSGDKTWGDLSLRNADFSDLVESVHRLGTADNGMDILLCEFKDGVAARDFSICLGYISPELK